MVSNLPIETIFLRILD